VSASPVEDRVTIELNPKERRLYDRLRERIREPGGDVSTGCWCPT
jgi:hypothetical protein